MRPLGEHRHETGKADMQFLFAEMFAWPDDIIVPLRNASQNKKGERLADTHAYLGFVASHAWIEGRYSEQAHVRWGLFMEAAREKADQVRPVLAAVLRRVNASSPDLAVGTLRPVPTFRKSVWHHWVGRQINVDDIPQTLRDVDSLIQIAARDIALLHAAIDRGRRADAAG